MQNRKLNWMKRLIIALCTLWALSLMGSPVTAQQGMNTDLATIKTYLAEKTKALLASTQSLQTAANSYFDLAKAAKFDYAALWKEKPADTLKALKAAREAWLQANPAYEQAEGIVAGVPSLAEFDLILDAGADAKADPENASPYEMTLPDGRVLKQPGNLFGILESTLWGTRKDFMGKAQIDLDGNGKIEFGEALPEANILKGAADTFVKYADELDKAGQKWQPNATDVFTALVVMIPTMSEYFEAWKQSRFVTGENAQQAEFNVVSRLADIQDILGGLQVVYKGVSPQVSKVDSARDRQITKGLEDLRAYVADLYKQEQSGKRFTPEEADLLGSEAQSRAERLAGSISQVAAQLKIKLPER